MLDETEAGKRKQSLIHSDQASAANPAPITAQSPSNPSLWGYFTAQLTSQQLDAPQATKHERVYNFLNLPEKLELVFQNITILKLILASFCSLDIGCAWMPSCTILRSCLPE